jgi:hypothetical protein
MPFSFLKKKNFTNIGRHVLIKYEGSNGTKLYKAFDASTRIALSQCLAVTVIK